MPGIKFNGMLAGTQATTPIFPLLAGKSLNGTGTPPAAVVRGGDVVCLSTNSAVSGLTVSGVVQPVTRMLLAADVTALYQDGSSNVCGMYGISPGDIATDSSGVANQQVTQPNIASSAQPVYSLPSYAAGIGAEQASGRSFVPVIPFNNYTVFAGRLWFASGTKTINAQYNGTLAGLKLVTANGVTTYMIDPAATTKCLRIVEADAQDPLYNTALLFSATQPYVFWQMLPAFCQALTGFNYSAQ